MYSTLLLVVMFGWCLEGGSATWTDKLLRGAKISSAELNSIGMAAAVRAEKAKQQSAQARAQSDACYCAAGKDYSAPCPVGWTVHKDGAECLAPAGYKGYCDVNQTFLLGDAGDKMEAESTCGMCWPCLDACDRDWTAPCPQGYTPQDIPFDKFSAMQFPECAADSDTKCQYMETFTSTEQKKSFQDTGCGAWACLGAPTCHKYGQCPNAWLTIGKDTCVAPKWYAKKTNCPPLMVFRDWTDAMRQQFAVECSVSFCADEEIAKDGVFIPEAAPEVDTSRCPLGWSPSSSNSLCHPPEGLAGLCTSPKSFAGMTHEQKIRWASDCITVRWPLEGETAEVASLVVSDGGAGPINNDGIIVSP